MAKKTERTGKELERQVVEAYRALGAWRVEHDVELAGHQIDVYVELKTQDHGLHRIAVEAKEHSHKVGIRTVEDFLSVVDHLRRERLIDEGLIVSVAGFSRPAHNAARTACIRLLELDDLQRDIVARRLLEQRLVNLKQKEASLKSLLHGRLVDAYVREAICAGLDPEELPEDNLGAILEQSVRQIVERDCHNLFLECGPVPPPEEFCRLLSYLGWYMFSEGITTCSAQDAVVVVREAMEGLQLDRYSSDQVLRWLAATYWLRKTRSDAFELRDNYVANVLAAMELKQWFAKGLGSVFLLGRTGDPGHKLGDEPGRWQQAIVPLAGMLPQDQAVELLESLLEERLPRLAGWSIATGQAMPHPIVSRVILALLD